MRPLSLLAAILFACAALACAGPALAVTQAPPPAMPERPHHAADGDAPLPWWQHVLGDADSPRLAGPYDGLLPFVNMPPDTGTYSEICGAFDPSNGQHIVVGTNSFVARSTAWYASSDFGRTWSFGYLPLTVNSKTYEFGADPAVTCDRQGRFYYAYLAYNTTMAGTAVTVAHSDDHGHTWTPVAAVESPSPSGYADDKEFLIADNTDSPYQGRLYLAWDRIVKNPLRYIPVVSRSLDRGATWSAPLTLDARGSKQLIGCYPAIGPHGEVVITWHAYDRNEVQCAHSLDGGATWSATSVVAVTHCGYGHTLDNYPSRTIGPSQSTDADRSSGAHRGRVYTAFVDAQGLSDFDVYVAWSDDSGTTWSAPMKLYDDPAHTDQFLPACTVNDADGSVTVGWYDRRNTGNTWADYYITRSLDGGATWEEQRVTARSINPFLCVDGFGDYSWLATSAVTGRTLPFWSDSSDSLHMNAATALADAPLLAFTGPDSASVVAAGLPYSLAWSLADSAGVDSVSLSLSTDAGRTFAFQATYPLGGTARGLAATVGGGSAWWTPPLVAADSCMLALDARNRLGLRTRRLTRGTFALRIPVVAGDPAVRETRPVVLVVPAVATTRGVACRVTGASPNADIHFDLLRADGRLVAHGVTRGESPWRWSGRDDSGASVASGVFWVRAQIGGAPSLMTRFVYLAR